jgi:hypothetical protein
MKLFVFNEFAASGATLEALGAVAPIDRAPAPNALATSEGEKAVIASNAKLIFDVKTPAEEVDAVVAKLVAAGLEVVHRKPVTSAGAPMQDRVIMRLAA